EKEVPKSSKPKQPLESPKEYPKQPSPSTSAPSTPSPSTSAPSTPHSTRVPSKGHAVKLSDNFIAAMGILLAKSEEEERAFLEKYVLTPMLGNPEKEKLR